MVPFPIPKNAFRTQEWFNLAREDVLRLRRTPPLVSFLVSWLVGGPNLSGQYSTLPNRSQYLDLIFNARLIHRHDKGNTQLRNACLLQ
jgi:hypothetical protein